MMYINYFRRIDCPYCKAVEEDFLRMMRMAYRIRKFDVDEEPPGLEVKRWRDVTGKTPAIEVQENGGVDWYIEYDGIEALADKVEESVEEEKYPAMIPVAVEGLT